MNKISLLVAVIAFILKSSKILIAFYNWMRLFTDIEFHWIK